MSIVMSIVRLRHRRAPAAASGAWLLPPRREGFAGRGVALGEGLGGHRRSRVWMISSRSRSSAAGDRYGCSRSARTSLVQSKSSTAWELAFFPNDMLFEHSLAVCSPLAISAETAWLKSMAHKWPDDVFGLKNSLRAQFSSCLCPSEFCILT